LAEGNVRLRSQGGRTAAGVVTGAMTEYFNLSQFFGGYLNQDWPDEYSDEWAALDEFLRDNPNAAKEFRPEIQTLLDQRLPEGELSRVIFYDLGCGFSAEVDGWKYRDWLQALSDYAAKAVGQPQAS
jgi:hypothetical protein